MRQVPGNNIGLNNSIVLSLSPSIQSLSAFKARLAAQPVTVLYELTAPIAIQGIPSAMTAYAPNCSIAVDQGIVTVQYVRDITAAFAKMEELIRSVS